MAIGLNFFIISGQGVDPLSTLLDGFVQFIPIALGTMISIFNLLLLIVVFIIDRKYIGIGSFINGVFLGVFSNMLLDNMLSLGQLPTAMLVFLGVLVFPLGISVYMKANLGFGSLESVMMLISDKVTLNMAYVRTALDVSFILIGIILGASFGYASILSALLNGKLISFYIHYLKDNLFILE